MTTKALQDLLPFNTCFGCGPSNPEGMQLKSYWSDDRKSITAVFKGEPKFNAGFLNAMYGGTVASLIDCHSIWTAVAFAHEAEQREVGSDPAILYVTKEITVKYLKPTPLEKEIWMKSWVEEVKGKQSIVICELGSESLVTATGRTIAVKVNG